MAASSLQAAWEKIKTAAENPNCKDDTTVAADTVTMYHEVTSALAVLFSSPDGFFMYNNKEIYGPGYCYVILSLQFGND